MLELSILLSSPLITNSLHIHTHIHTYYIRVQVSGSDDRATVLELKDGRARVRYTSKDWDHEGCWLDAAALIPFSAAIHPSSSSKHSCKYHIGDRACFHFYTSVSQSVCLSVSAMRVCVCDAVMQSPLTYLCMHACQCESVRVNGRRALRAQ